MFCISHKLEEEDADSYLDLHYEIPHSSVWLLLDWHIVLYKRSSCSFIKNIHNLTKTVVSTVWPFYLSIVALNLILEIRNKNMKFDQHLFYWHLYRYIIQL